MDWHLALGLSVVVGATLLMGGLWIGAAMGITGLVGIAAISGPGQWQVVGDVLWNSSNSFTLAAIPLFVLMGEIILRSGLSQRLYAGLSFWLAWLPGGLAHSSLFGCALFSALSGSSTATAMTVGTVAMPEMSRRGYDARLTLGSLAAGGCLGILIPPSIVLIVYGTIAQESIVSLFMAGIVPGLLVLLLFMTYVLVRALIDPALAPRERVHVDLAGIGRSALLAWPLVLLLMAVIGGMYAGLVTPTEAAGLGCLGALLLALGFRQFRWTHLVESLGNAAVTTCVVMFIIVNAQILMVAMALAGVPQGLARVVTDAGLSPWQFFAALCAMYAVMGMFLDGISMMLLTVPVLWNGVRAMGFDGVWFGVALVLLIEIGQITPPMGLNLFAIHSIAGGRPFRDVALGALPYTSLLAAAIVLIYLFPDLVLFLPNAMQGR